MKNAKLALSESMKSLNIESIPVDSRKHYNIVEFCTDYLKLPLQESIDISTELMDSFPFVRVYENATALDEGILDKIGNAVRGKFGAGYSEPPRLEGKPTAAKPSMWNPIQKAKEAVQDYAGTRDSVLRNAPMIAVTDEDAGITNYYAYPDLDVYTPNPAGGNGRPGHARVFKAILSGLNTGGKKATAVGINDYASRSNAQKDGRFTAIRLDQDNNRKKELAAAVDKLEKLIATNKTLLANNFISDEEAANLTGELGNVSQLVNKIAASAKEDDAKLEVKAETVAEATPAAAPVAAPTPGTPPPAAKPEGSGFTDVAENIMGDIKPLAGSGSVAPEATDSLTAISPEPAGSEPDMTIKEPASPEATAPETTEAPTTEAPTTEAPAEKAPVAEPKIVADELAKRAKAFVAKNRAKLGSSKSAEPTTTEPVTPEASAQTLSPEEENLKNQMVSLGMSEADAVSNIVSARG